MKYIQFGGKNVSQICLGTARFGTIVDEEKSYEMMDFFVDNGGNCLDTARNYYEWISDGRGKSERTIGKWINRRGNREELFISTKGGLIGSGKDGRVNLSRDNILSEISDSLDALQTDYIDLYLLHKDEINRPVEEIVDTMQVLLNDYNVKHIGVANWTLDRLIGANEYAKQHDLQAFEVVQTWWSVAEYTNAMWNDDSTTYMSDDMYDYLIMHNMIGMGYTSQCKGFFQKAGKHGVDSIDPFLKKRIVTPNNLAILEKIKQFAEEYNVSITDLVNSYITSNELSGIAIVSCSNMGQLADIVTHCDYEFDKDKIAEIDLIKNNSNNT